MPQREGIMGCGENQPDQLVCCRCTELFDTEVEHVHLFEGRMLCFACVVEIVGQVNNCLSRNRAIYDQVAAWAAEAAELAS